MCGIAGIARLDGKTVDITAFMKVLMTMPHRGPDDEDSVLLESSSHG
jgi:asparagine synthetase B (glutamine-hydrolysing)